MDWDPRKTHRDLIETNLEKLDGIGPSKELPSNLLQQHWRHISNEQSRLHQVPFKVKQPFFLF